MKTAATIQEVNTRSGKWGSVRSQTPDVPAKAQT